MKKNTFDVRSNTENLRVDTSPSPVGNVPPNLDKKNYSLLLQVLTKQACDQELAMAAFQQKNSSAVPQRPRTYKFPDVMVSSTPFIPMQSNFDFAKFNFYGSNPRIAVEKENHPSINNNSFSDDDNGTFMIFQMDDVEDAEFRPY